MYFVFVLYIDFVFFFVMKMMFEIGDKICIYLLIGFSLNIFLGKKLEKLIGKIYKRIKKKYFKVC